MSYPVELAQGILIASIALVGFCGVFLGQIKFTDKPSTKRQISHVDHIRRGLSELAGNITESD